MLHRRTAPSVLSLFSLLVCQVYLSALVLISSDIRFPMKRRYFNLRAVCVSDTYRIWICARYALDMSNRGLEYPEFF